MNGNKKFYILGGILILIAVGFTAFALTHPEMSFPWANWVSYAFYGLYAIFTILIFCMPKFKNPSLASCGILAIQFIALAMIVFSIALHKETGSTNWYLPAGLFLTCIGNFANLFLNKKKEGKEETTE